MVYLCYQQNRPYRDMSDLGSILRFSHLHPPSQNWPIRAKHRSKTGCIWDRRKIHLLQLIRPYVPRPISNIKRKVWLQTSILPYALTLCLHKHSYIGSLGAIVSCGLAKGHRSNPACSLRILSTYGTPVLMSGLGSLVLSPYETSIVDQQYKRTLQCILKLSVNSPSSLVHFAAGSLPGSALLDLRQLALFGMICRLSGNPLNIHAKTPQSSSFTYVLVLQGEKRPPEVPAAPPPGPAWDPTQEGDLQEVG